MNWDQFDMKEKTEIFDVLYLLRTRPGSIWDLDEQCYVPLRKPRFERVRRSREEVMCEEVTYLRTRGQLRRHKEMCEQVLRDPLTYYRVKAKHAPPTWPLYRIRSNS